MFRWEIEIITGSGAGLLRQHGLAKYPPVLRILKFVLNGLWGTFPRLRQHVIKIELTGTGKPSTVAMFINASSNYIPQ